MELNAFDKIVLKEFEGDPDNRHVYEIAGSVYQYKPLKLPKSFAKDMVRVRYSLNKLIKIGKVRKVLVVRGRYKQAFYYLNRD